MFLFLIFWAKNCANKLTYLQSVKLELPFKSYGVTLEDKQRNRQISRKLVELKVRAHFVRTITTEKIPMLLSVWLY